MSTLSIGLFQVLYQSIRINISENVHIIPDIETLVIVITVVTTYAFTIYTYIITNSKFQEIKQICKSPGR